MPEPDDRGKQAFDQMMDALKFDKPLPCSGCTVLRERLREAEALIERVVDACNAMDEPGGVLAMQGMYDYLAAREQGEQA